MAGFGEQDEKREVLDFDIQSQGLALLKTAVDYHTSGDLINAEKAYRDAMSSGLIHPSLFTNLGVICKNSGRLHEAIVLYEKAIELTPNDPDPYVNLGNLFRDLRQPDLALVSTLKGLELKPDILAGHINLGLIYKDLGQLDQALASMLKCLELNSDNADVHMHLGLIYRHLGRLDDALSSTLKSLEFRPDNPITLLNLGNIYDQLGQLEQAFFAAKKCMELDPYNPNCYILISRLYLKVKKPVQAKKVCEQGLMIRRNDIRLQINQSSALSQITPIWHIAMINDADRNRCYLEAINQAVKPNDLVLDIGAGSGLLSMMASDAGASRVIACELVIPIANKAQDIVRKNGFTEKISVFGMKSTDLTVGIEMPRKADVIISEIFSSEMVGEGILATLRDSRERLLKQGGIMIPEQAEIKFALIGPSPEISSMTNPGVNSCYFLEDFSEICPRKLSVQLREKPNLLSSAETAFCFDFLKEFAFNQEKDINVSVTRDGQCIGILQWLRTNLFGDIVLENVPGESTSHWSSNIYLFQNSIKVKQGQSVEISALVDKDILWFKCDHMDS